MKILCEHGPLNGIQDIPEEAFDRDGAGRTMFTTSDHERYHRCEADTDEGLPRFRWNPRTRHDQEED